MLYLYTINYVPTVTSHRIREIILLINNEDIRRINIFSMCIRLCTIFECDILILIAEQRNKLSIFTFVGEIA